jgi:hypothetical protein
MAAISVIKQEALGVNAIKLFYLSLTAQQNKLEWLVKII